MLGYKIYINYLLWRVGLRDVLPAAIVNRVRVADNGEKLKKIQNTELRSGVCERLRAAQSKLPNGIRIKILSGFRPLSEQQKIWDEKIAELRHLYPNAGEEELKRTARLRVADPANGGGGHQTGGAVDLTLCDSHGHELDMGGKYLNFDDATPTKAVKNKNRRMLVCAMKEAGFTNYPREWWHFSYGDKMWAAYSRKKNAVYDTIRTMRGA
ncbi:MAG: D-alanyl-D-alanine carboxypeptidase family protein [Rickettsiales bacterium]|jgi:D-alanyl-D-alanine dipeptidase|nr:D-alanyl-D-alanine carboxypeptidase family protein [Rickettsiales bacterium]